MDNKEKEQKLASSSNQEAAAETNDLLIDEEQNTTNLAPDAKKTKNDSPLNENATCINQQYLPILQRSYTPQSVDQSLLNSRTYVSTQLPSPIVASQWQQLPSMQPDPASNQVQQGQPPLQLAQSTVPFWMPPRPGYYLPGVNMPSTFQTFTPIGTINASWQAPAVIGGATSSSNQPQIPNFCYPVGYPYPGFPGPWDPSSWCAPSQQSQVPCTYACPGGYGYASSMPPMAPGCSTSLGQSSQRGIIRPLTKLSQKHQQLWEAQSAENVQLWNVIDQLQSELANCKSCLTKLEAEVSSLTSAVEEPTAQAAGTASSRQTSKRGRPRRSATSVNALPTPDEPYPRAQSRKPTALSRVQSSKARTLIFEKVSLNKVEDKVKACQSQASTQKENDQQISNIITTGSGNKEANVGNLMMTAFNNQVCQENPGIQISDIQLNSSSKMNNTDDKADDSETVFSIFSQQAKGIHSKGFSATPIRNKVNGNFGWPSYLHPEGCGRNVFNTSSQGFYDNSSVIREREKHIPGWSFVDEGNETEQLEDVVVALAKNDNEEEMGDDASSGAEEIAPTKDEAAYTWIVR